MFRADARNIAPRIGAKPAEAKPWSVLPSTLAHALLIALLLLIPLTQPQALPVLSAATPIVRSRTILADGLTAPTRIPPIIGTVVDDPADAVTQSLHTLEILAAVTREVTGADSSPRRTDG
jgi:hypothetical protein